jgi:replicative DNA helicase
MSKVRLATRFFALHEQLDYERVRLGRLTSEERARFFATLDRLKEEDGIYLVAENFDYTIEGLEAAIEEVEPDIYIIDGAYMIKSEGKSIAERGANLFNELKRLNTRVGIPAIVTTQLNRQADPKKRETVRDDKIAQSDVAGWNTDCAVAMIQTDDMQADNRMDLKLMKVREARRKSLEIMWCVASNFDELPARDDDEDFEMGDAAETGGGSLNFPTAKFGSLTPGAAAPVDATEHQEKDADAGIDDHEF